MSTNPIFLAAFLTAVFAAAPTDNTAVSAAASNPIRFDRFIADPSAHVFNDRVYLYVTDDSGNDGHSWNSKTWRAYSSEDLVNWTDHGPVFGVSASVQGVPKFAWGSDFAWAPAAATRNGNYYLYLPVDGPLQGQSKIGVASSTSPASGFCDARGGNPLVAEGLDANAGTQVIDPMVFVDDDLARTPYLYYGGHRRDDKGSELKAVRLQDDMIHLQGSIQTLEATHYGEAPWVHKRNGKYYLSYSTGWPGQIAYATSNHPLGPFTYRGILFDYVNVTTNHHSIVHYRNQWYLFYHKAALPGGGSCRRSVQIDCLYYDDDGTIRPVEETAGGVVAGSCGVPPSTPPLQPSPVVIPYRLQSFNFPDRFLRHFYFRARIDPNVSPPVDAQFLVNDGLSTCAGVSFESVNFRRHFLRHRNREVWLAKSEDNDLFKADATFYRRRGLANPEWYSYESVNYPGEYLRHFRYEMVIGPVTGSNAATLRADATFREVK